MATMTNAMEKVVEQVNNDPSAGYKVEFNPIPYTDFFAKLNTALAGGTAVDVIGSGFGQMGALAGVGNLLVLDDYIAEWPDADDIYQGLFGVVEGQTMALLLPESRPVMYRADMFEAAGLDPNRAPATMDEMRRYANKLAKRSSAGELEVDGWGTNFGAPEQLAVIVSAQFGSLYLWDSDGTIIIDKGILDGLSYIQSLIFEDKVCEPYPHGEDPKIVRGKAAMTMRHSSWTLPTLAEQFPGKVKIGLPPNKHTFTTGVFVCVNSNSQYKDESADFLWRVYQEENLWTLWEVAGFIPARKSMRAEFVKENPDWNPVLMDTMANAFAYKHGPAFFDVLKVVRPKLEEMYLQNSEPRPLLEQAAEEMKQIQKEKGY
jgi:ABC-type glycerol-3-phosphate transport system substrate-binding protein